MRKRDLWKKVLMTGTAITMMLSSMTAAAAGEHDGRLTDRAEHTDKNFEDYEYDRMDVAEFDAIIEGLDELVADTANADKVLDVIVAMEDYYCEAGRNYSIAHIHSDLVADDQFWDDEVMFWDELTTDIGDKIMTSYNVIATSPNADVLHERVDDEDDWQDILDYQVMTQEQKDLSAKETELSLQYDILYNKEYTTKVNGKDYTEEELDDLVADGTLDHDGYQTAYADLLTQMNKERAELYLQLVDVRTQLARSYGYDNFADYAYEKRYGRDYTTDELKEYREQVKNYIVPLQDELMMELYGSHYSEFLKMFDQEMSEQDCLDTLRKYLPEISSDLLVSLDYMEEHNLYDLSIDDAKAPGGYTISIGGYNAPFIYNCADGSIQDMETLIHEFGHYNQMYYMTPDSWYYDEGNLDLAEIHSQGLELLFMDFADDIYGDYAEVMKLYTLFNLTYATVEGCKEDAFQYEVYTNADGLTVDKLNEIYYNCCIEYSDRFGAMLNESISMAQSGYLPQGISYDWVQIPHTFQSPMYYISYSVSAAAVFELFDVILDDRDEGIDTYLALVDAEYQQSFQETMDTVGLNNPIANPRFDLYADDIRYAVGLEDERTVVNDYDAHQPTTYWGETGTAVSAPEDEQGGTEEVAEPEATPADDDADDPDTDDAGTDRDKERDDRSKIAAILAVAMFGVAAIVIIIVAVKVSKEKKAQQNAQMNRMPNTPNPYMNQNRAPGQNMQSGMGAGPYVQQGGIAPNAQQPINPYMQQNAANNGGIMSNGANVSQPINPYMQNPQPIQPAAQSAPVSSAENANISSANIMENSNTPINPYTSGTAINPYAQQQVQINPYAQQAPNPYLQNLQAMQQQNQTVQQGMQAQNQAMQQDLQAQSQAAQQVQANAVNAQVYAAQDMANTAAAGLAGAAPMADIDLPVPEEELRQVVAQIPADRKEGILAMIREGKKLEAIKECRELTGTGLIQAKTIVEQFERFLI